MQIYLSQPRGFCAGVTRAVTIVERALAIYGRPVYIRHEIVHNKTVVDNLRNKGAVFVDSLDEVPEKAILIFSAHGISKAEENKARARDLTIFDATCPLVTKVHREITSMHQKGYFIAMIGHKGHPEVQGTMGQIDNKDIALIENSEDVNALTCDKPMAYATQTTISIDDSKKIIDALKAKFPLIVAPKKDDVCYATQHRQDAVKKLAGLSDLVLVIGSQTSSNSNRLREICEKKGTAAYLIENAAAINTAWFTNVNTVGITAGASAPENLVSEVVSYLKGTFAIESIQALEGIQEDVVFPLPKGLWKSDLEKAAE